MCQINFIFSRDYLVDSVAISIKNLVIINNMSEIELLGQM